MVCCLECGHLNLAYSAFENVKYQLDILISKEITLKSAALGPDSKLPISGAGRVARRAVGPVRTGAPPHCQVGAGAGATGETVASLSGGSIQATGETAASLAVGPATATVETAVSLAVRATVEATALLVVRATGETAAFLATMVGGAAPASARASPIAASGMRLTKIHLQTTQTDSFKIGTNRGGRETRGLSQITRVIISIIHGALLQLSGWFAKSF